MATPSSDDEANQVFFNKTPAPIELPEIQNQLIKFIEFHNTHQNKIVLVTVHNIINNILVLIANFDLILY
jgi:phosphopantothenate-cysteine ligase